MTHSSNGLISNATAPWVYPESSQEVTGRLPPLVEYAWRRKVSGWRTFCWRRQGV